MKDCKTAQTWEKTRLSNLVRHKRSGGYYARAYANGKVVWRTLKTTHFSVAEARLAEFLKEHRQKRNAHADASSAKLTFAAAAEIYLQRLSGSVSIKRRTRECYIETLAALKKSWPALVDMEVRWLTPTQCRDWAAPDLPREAARRALATPWRLSAA